jgi:hypothetical protein
VVVVLGGHNSEDHFFTPAFCYELRTAKQRYHSLNQENIGGLGQSTVLPQDTVTNCEQVFAYLDALIKLFVGKGISVIAKREV